MRPASGLKTVRDVVDGVKGGDGSQRVILDTPVRLLLDPCPLLSETLADLKS